MVRYFSLSLLVGMSSLFAMETAPEKMTPLNEVDFSGMALEFSPEVVRTEGLGEEVGLFYDEEGFFVRNETGDVRVKRHDTDNTFRKKSSSDIVKYVASQSQFKVTKFDNGEYSVSATDELKGGGPCLAIASAIGVRLIGWSVSVPFLFIPGGQPIFLAGCAMTENAANAATAIALVSPTA